MTRLKNFLAIVMILCTGTVMANRPLEIIVPFAAGGLTDNLARYAGNALKEKGVDNIVVNKPGAAGVIGVKFAKENRNANGTILMLAGGPGLIAPYTLIPQPYDIAKDFQPISLIARDIMTVTVPSNSPYQTLNDLISAMKTTPNKLTWAHASDINRISGTMILQKTGTQAVAIPYNGGQQALTSLLGNQVDFTVSGVADVKIMSDSGRVRILAVADKKRHPALPNVPTFSEMGVDFEHSSFYAFYATLDTPKSVIDQFNTVVLERMRQDTGYEFLHVMLVPNFLGPNGLRQWYDQQVKIWRPIIEKNRPQQ